MRPLLLCILVALAGACKKSKETTDLNGGVWIEKTLRLDTLVGILELDGNEGKHYFSLRSGPYDDAPTGSFYQKSHRLIYGYYFEGRDIRIHAATTATMNFDKYEFAWGPDNRTFTIKKFYGRNALPATLEFKLLSP